jgi:hypothetical protein
VTTKPRGPTPEHAAYVVEPPAHDPLSDTRIRSLLVRYAALAQAQLTEISPDLLELSVPASDRKFFQKRERVLIAFSLGALESDPEAEMAVIGSAFMEELLSAIRAHGARLSLGLVAPAFSADASAVTLDVGIANGSAGTPEVNVARHTVGRLLARVLFRAGAVVEEHLAESGWFDFTTGAPLSSELVECCAALERGNTSAVPASSFADATISTPKPVDELVNLMLGELRSRLTSDVDRLHADAEQALAAELGRIDGYYASLLGDGLMKADERRTVEAEYERRAAEERRRHQVRAVVHPLQTVETELLVQRAEWTIETPKGRVGRFVSHRALSGSGAWALSCPICAGAAQSLVVCKEDHIACGACGLTCSVCTEEFCRGHGIDACHVDAAPACREHSRTCDSCHRDHCTTHEGQCAEGGHLACTSCLDACGICARVVCATHAVMTSAGSPLGARRLCRECTVYCQGGRSEAVGRDEVTQCASCERSVCSIHRAVCVVDQQVHCSTHLRRTDRSRRLVCATHRVTCAHEPEAVLASDEVGSCGTCGAAVCQQHTGACIEDGGRHCLTHLSPLKDRGGAFACEAHRRVCHIDNVAFSLGGTTVCPVCQRASCVEHTRGCAHCGRNVCASDWDGGVKRCATCDQLRVWDEPSDAALAAAIEANGGEAPSAKEWRIGRDATHVIVELSHRWRRRTVLALRHGDNRAEHVVTHSALGSSRKR